jgi:uncharacterized membrane protein YhfC
VIIKLFGGDSDMGKLATSVSISGGMIGFMLLTGIVMFLIPIGTYWGLKRHYKLVSTPVWVGIAVFIVAVMILERILHMIILQPSADGSIALATHHPYMYVAYGALVAGIFEETGRFFGFRYLKKRVSGFGTAIAYGIGHGGIEMILIGTMEMVNLVVMSVAINSRNAAVLSKLPSGTIHSLISHAGAATTSSFFERIAAFIIQILLSIIVWASVNYVGKIWLYPLAIGLHALIDTPAAMFQAGIISNELTVEIVLWISVLAMGVFVYLYIGKLRKSRVTTS